MTTTQRATRDSWPISPLPDARARLAIRNAYSAEDYARIGRGFVPHDGDDRWFIYLEDDWLSIHRSWTGQCIYRVRFAPDGEQSGSPRRGRTATPPSSAARKMRPMSATSNG